ncbi:MAG: DUF1015 domain-containing protein [Alphaproteobacteria bacterium]
MPLFRPFSAIRPTPDKAGEIIAPPYDVLNTEEAKEKAKGKPLSFLHVSKPEIDLPDGIDHYAPEVYAKAAENFKKMLDSGVLKRDSKACYYVYRATMGSHVQTGLVVAASCADYDTNRIRKHEFTRPVKEDDRVRQIEAVGAQTGPALLAYRQIKAVADIIADTVNKAPAYDVLGDNDVRHALWVIDNDKYIATITEEFSKAEAVYIADGHHRSAAGSRVAKAMAAKNPNHKGDEAYNSFLAVAFPANEMKIYDYNRVVKDLNGLTEAELLEKIGKNYDVSKETSQVKPVRPQEMGLYINKSWYRLTLKPEVKLPFDPVERLDVSLLSDLVLAPVLGIEDLRKSERIDFVGGIRGLGELEKRVDSGEMVAAFAMYPTSMEDLMAVAEAGKVMPPKSTWFEPKLADGMASNPLC